MRKPGSAPPDLLPAPVGRWTTVADVTLELATPMLGGGAVAGHPDVDQPFRPSAIRGSLRSWWRRTASFTSATDLRTREAALWGLLDNGTTESRVRVRVDKISCLAPVIRRTYNPIIGQRNPLSYAHGVLTEPIAGANAVADADALRISVSATCRLRVEVRGDADVEEVQRALSAWLLFGGVGARTRRGFGALKWEGFQPMTQFPGDPGFTVSGFPSLLGARLLIADAPNAMGAWERAIGNYRDFRKGQMPAAPRPNQGANSHSPWPEADSLRPLAQRLAALPGGPAYPRAELGLPLQLRSMQNHTGAFGNHWIPGTDGNTRLASPVIVKPILWNGQWKAGLLLMHRGRLTLSGGHSTNGTGMPRTLHGRPGWAPEAGGKSDILDTLALVLRAYGYRLEPIV